MKMETLKHSTTFCNLDIRTQDGFFTSFIDTCNLRRRKKTMYYLKGI